MHGVWIESFVTGGFSIYVYTFSMIQHHHDKFHKRTSLPTTILNLSNMHPCSGEFTNRQPVASQSITMTFRGDSLSAAVTSAVFYRSQIKSLLGWFLVGASIKEHWKCQ